MADKPFDEYDWLYEYTCYECGAVMDIVGDVLVCPKCGHSIEVKDWSTEPQDYEEYYPTREEIVGYGDDDDDENSSGEYYDPMIDE